MRNEEQILAAYLILECEFGCTEEELKSSYRQLVKVWHPDRFDGDPKLRIKATEKMKLINEAYQLLLKNFEDRDSLDETADTQTTAPQQTQAEFEVGSERVKINRFGPSHSGEYVFCKEVVSTRAFDGCVLTRQKRSFKTRAVNSGSNFDFAAKDSLSFSLNPEQGSRRRIYQEGLQRNDYDETEFSFPDGSSVVVENRVTDILSCGIHDWQIPRFSLEEIKEDYQFFKSREEWKQCVLFGQKAVDLHRQNAWGWIHRSFALHCLSLTKAALWALKRAVEFDSQFSNVTLIYYNLACYSSQLGDANGAKDWLKTAFKLARKEGSFERYNKMAVADSDLLPIRSAIPQLALVSSISRFF